MPNDLELYSRDAGSDDLSAWALTAGRYGELAVVCRRKHAIVRDGELQVDGQYTLLLDAGEGLHEVHDLVMDLVRHNMAEHAPDGLRTVGRVPTSLVRPGGPLRLHASRRHVPACADAGMALGEGEDGPEFVDEIPCSCDPQVPWTVVLAPAEAA